MTGKGGFEVDGSWHDSPLDWIDIESTVHFGRYSFRA
jgi:hypothetical protein